MISFLAIVLLLTANITQAQQSNFSGSWFNPNLEMIPGIQYSNAVPKQIKVTQTKDSLKLERTSAGSDGDVTVVETIPLNGKTVTRVGKTSKRTINNIATWSKDGKTLTIISEVWELSANGTLVITKTSDATVTDDWTIKAEYSKE